MSAVLLDYCLNAAELATGLRQRFEDYNAEFTRITRKAARRFIERDWHAGRADAVKRIELYEQHVSGAIEALRQELGDINDLPGLVRADGRFHHGVGLEALFPGAFDRRR